MHDDEMLESELPPEVMGKLDAASGPRVELEDAVVGALAARGAFRTGTIGDHRGRWTANTAWIAGAAMAASVMFMIGLHVGEHRAAAPSISAPGNATDARDSALTTARVRAAGADYIRALARVNPNQPDAYDAAMATFRTASDQIVRIAPTSSLALAMGIAFPSSFADAPASLATSVAPMHLIRF